MTELTTLLIRLPLELKNRLEERTGDEGVASTNAWVVDALEKLLGKPIPTQTLRTQHKIARQVLPLIFAAESEGRDLSYKALLQKIGRAPDEGRMMGAVCDLIDAASALAGVPLISLWRVKTAGREHNPRAFADNPGLKKALLDEARRHVFTDADQAAIQNALDELKDKGNRAAWRFVEENRPKFATIAEPEGEPSAE